MTSEFRESVNTIRMPADPYRQHATFVESKRVKAARLCDLKKERNGETNARPAARSALVTFSGSDTLCIEAPRENAAPTVCARTCVFSGESEFSLALPCGRTRNRPKRHSAALFVV